MKDICLKYIYINGVVAKERVFIDVVLNRVYFVVEKNFLALDVSRKAPYAVIHSNYIGVETSDQIVEG